MLEQRIALDPKYAHAHAWKACVLGQRGFTAGATIAASLATR